MTALALGGRGRDSPGVALPFVLLLLLALTGLAHGGLALSRGSGLLARARAGRVQAELLAEGALRVLGAELARGDREALPPPGEARSRPAFSPAPGFETRVVHRRLGPEWHLLEAVAAARTPRGRARAGMARVAWILDPVARIGAVGAALEHGGRLEIREGARVDGSAFARVSDAGLPGACAPYRAALDSLVARGGIRHAAGLPDAPGATGGSPGPPDPYARTPGIGLLSGASLAALVEGGGGTGGETAPGALDLDGTVRRGIFVVGGDLAVRPGATVRGVVLVGGDLEVADAAHVSGWVRVRGRVLLGRGARIRGSGCAVGLALDQAIPRAPPVFPPGGFWPLPP